MGFQGFTPRLRDLRDVLIDDNTLADLDRLTFDVAEERWTNLPASGGGEVDRGVMLYQEFGQLLTGPVNYDTLNQWRVNFDSNLYTYAPDGQQGLDRIVLPFDVVTAGGIFAVHFQAQIAFSDVVQDPTTKEMIYPFQVLVHLADAQGTPGSDYFSATYHPWNEIGSGNQVSVEGVFDWRPGDFIPSPEGRNELCVRMQWVPTGYSLDPPEADVIAGLETFLWVRLLTAHIGIS